MNRLANYRPPLARGHSGRHRRRCAPPSSRGTAIEDLSAGSFPDRPWDNGNNPKTAVHECLKTHPGFEIDKDNDNMLLISVAPNGYLKRVSW